MDNHPSAYYLGRIIDPATGRAGSQPMDYDPADLTTHGFVVGMTGSGKTGLCITLLEEAALNGTPALIVDPKGDLTNLLLHFPGLLPSDFQPWIDPEAARRAGKTPDALAVEIAASWKTGLAGSGIGPERIAQLGASTKFAVYTPGSDAGYPVSILASLKAPAIPWEGNREILREKISSTVTAVLGLVGVKDIDPVRSREHILLSNIFESAWSQGKDLDLTELILQTQTPPFERLGVFPVDKFFPEADRFNLAMLLNNFLAAPAFQAWVEGEPLDVASLLYTPGGSPRHSIFYLAHLDEGERMFFVTLLFSAVEAWMRTQAGLASLRALLYFDEIMGYLPPVANPPSKPIILRMLKQARAFGVGLLLASQNPVDIDYKALSNAGTWFIGKLQTDQDKQRLLDGLESASGGRDRAELDRLISSLDKRVFLLNNVHKQAPQLFTTRWTMNYLAGPLTRAQIPGLNRLANSPTQAQTSAPAQIAPLEPTGIPPSYPPAANPDPVSPSAKPAAPAPNGTATRPAIPAGVNEYFMPNNLTLGEAIQSAGQAATAQFAGEMLYCPALLGQVTTRYLDRKIGLDFEERRCVMTQDPDRRGAVRWDQAGFPALDPALLVGGPLPQARFASLDVPLSDAKAMATLQKDFVDWAYRTGNARIKTNPTLKVFAGPETSPEAFAAQCREAAIRGRDAEAAKMSDSYDRKIATLKDRLAREQRELQKDETELSQRKTEELITGGETLLSLFGGRKRRVSTAVTKHRMTQQAKADVEESRNSIADLQGQIAELERARAQDLQEVDRRWQEIAGQVSEITRPPLRKDIFVDFFGLVWLPFYVLHDGEKLLKLPAFG